MFKITVLATATAILAILMCDEAQAGCMLVRTQTTTPGCYGYVGYSNGLRVGWFRRSGTWVRSGSATRCELGGLSSTQIGPDAVRLADGTKVRLDAKCENGQDF
jgi:hypothetical protein